MVVESKHFCQISLYKNMLVDIWCPYLFAYYLINHIKVVHTDLVYIFELISVLSWKIPNFPT